MATRLDIDDFPLDPDELCETAETILTEDTEKAGNAFLILGQLDPTATGADGEPLYTASQQTLIVEAKTQLDAWRES